LNVVGTLIEALGSSRQRVRTGAEGPHAYASEAGACVRQVALSILTDRAEGDPDLRSEVTFRIGRDLEAAVLRAIELQVPAVQFQVPWIDGLVAGIADALYTEEGLRWVVEVKTCSFNSYQSVIRNGPRREHTLQAALSARALGGHMLHIIYVCKNAPAEVAPVMEFHLEVPWAEAAVAHEGLSFAVRQAQAHVIPAPMWNGRVIQSPDLPDSWPCRYCPFADVCRALGPGDVPVTGIQAVVDGAPVRALQ